MLLRSSDVRTSEPLLPVVNCTPARFSRSVSGVPRSLIVVSVASSRPPDDTAMNGRPAAGGSTPWNARSDEVTVTPCSLSRPPPV